MGTCLKYMALLPPTRFYLNISPEAGFGATLATRLVTLLRPYHFGWPGISTEVTVHIAERSNRLAVYGHIPQRYVRNGYPTPTLPPKFKMSRERSGSDLQRNSGGEYKTNGLPSLFWLVVCFQHGTHANFRSNTSTQQNHKIFTWSQRGADESLKLETAVPPLEFYTVKLNTCE